METAILVTNIILVVAIIFLCVVMVGNSIVQHLQENKQKEMLKEYTHELVNMKLEIRAHTEETKRHSEELGKQTSEIVKVVAGTSESTLALKSVEEAFLKMSAMQVKSSDALRQSFQVFTDTVSNIRGRVPREPSPYTPENVEAEMEHGAAERDQSSEVDSILKEFPGAIRSSV